jgi:hypothetical protein
MSVISLLINLSIIPKEVLKPLNEMHGKGRSGHWGMKSLSSAIEIAKKLPMRLPDRTMPASSAAAERRHVSSR